MADQEIQRWGQRLTVVDLEEGATTRPTMEGEANGKWVLYTDHLAALAERDAGIEALAGTLEAKAQEQADEFGNYVMADPADSSGDFKEGRAAAYEEAVEMVRSLSPPVSKPNPEGEAVEPTREQILAGMRELDLWSDDALRKEIDGYRMAELVIRAALAAPSGVTEEEER